MLGLGGNEQIRIFGGSASTKFVKKMCDYLGCPVGDNTTLVFSEGNTFVRINESVRDKDVYLVQTIGLNPNNEFMELVFYIDALKRASANSVTVIMPYFSYAKGDKKDEPRVSIRGRVCADMLEKAGADRVLTMDLHAAQVQGFFSKPVDHLYAQPLLAAYARHAGIVTPERIDDIVVVSPDAGSAKRARAMADELGCAVAIGDKMRVGHDENAKVLEIIGDVKGKKCILFDDMVDTAGSLCNAAKAIVEIGGATEVYACATHGVLSGPANERIANSCIKELTFLNTIPPLEGACSKIKYLDVSPIFADAIQRIYEENSMSVLF